MDTKTPLPLQTAATTLLPSSSPVPFPTSSTSQPQLAQPFTTSTTTLQPQIHPQTQPQAPTQDQQPQQQQQQQVYPHQIDGAGGPTATAPFLRDFSLVAEAAKRAQMSVVMRDLESVSL